MRFKKSRWGAIVASLALVLGLAVVPATAAAALPDPAPGDVTSVATLDKTASATQVVPGETFTYTLTITCSSITDLGCRGAVLADDVPAPFVLVSAAVGGGQNTAAPPIINGNSLTVNWNTPLGDGTVGLLDATTGIVEITALLPADVSYDYNGVSIVNDAVIEGTNFVDDDGQVAVTPIVPLDLETTPTKTFSPDAAIATPGTPVGATLTGANESNATVDTLVIQDPVDPDAAPNPFDYLAFAGFGAVTPPPGATATTYYVYVDGAWVEAPGGVLPGTIDPADVKGTQVVFTGAIPAGASGSVVLDLEVTQLAADQPEGTVVNNTVQSEVGLGDQSATGQAGDDFTILQNNVQVSASKSFDPALVIAGESTTVTLGAVNNSTIPLDSLTIREPSTGSFPDDYVFDGFTAGIGCPANATGGTVVYTTTSGPVEVPFACGETPQLPGGDNASVTSFEVVFEAEDAIIPGAETSIQFGLVTDENATDLPTTVPNEVFVEGQNDGAVGDDTATADLYIYDEVIETYIGKTIRPSQILGYPGETVTVSLEGGLTERPNPPDSPTGSTGNADQVILQDPPDPVVPDDWWNAFDVTAITQTPIPADSTLTIEYYDTTTGEWVVLSGPHPGPDIYSEQIPADVQEVAGGIRFVYDYTGTSETGFPPGTDFAPNFTSELRPDGRYVPGPPFSDEESTFIPNCAQSDATSPTPEVPDASAVIPPDECPEIELIPADPGNADLIDKEFGTSSSGGLKSVIARSGDTIPSTLRWSTGGFSNIERMEITDIADPAGTALADSVFDAFNLTRVNPITTATDPLIAYDQVQQVLLFDGTTWVDAANDPCPGGCVGQFPGMNLTAAEQQSTLGVRLVFVESPDRAAASEGNLDAPPVGSGVARSFGNDRPIELVWQVRDEKRSDGTPVLGDELYNLAGPGEVLNTVNATGYPADGGTPLSADDSDVVIIIDVPLTTTTDKNWDGGPLAPPTDPSVVPNQYPLSRVTITTRNTTPARVDQLIITDTAPGSVTDRRQDPFQAFTFNNFSRIDEPAGTQSTLVRLFCPTGNPFVYDRDGALALTPATMPCDVAGIQVEFDGRIASNAAGVVAFDLRLRPFWRGTMERVSVADTPILNTAEGVIADIDPAGTCPPPQNARYACDQGAAVITLEDPSFSVIAGKSISPAQQREDDFSEVTVTLTGQPQGSARARTLILTDDDPTFWNAFDFVGMDPSWDFVPPTGRVHACYLDGGVFSAANVAAGTVGGTWTCQPLAVDMPIADAVAFLAAAPDTLHGVSFQFWQDNDLGWQNPVHPVVPVPFLVERRVDLRSGGPVPTTRSDQVPAPGETEAGVFSNTVVVDSMSANVGEGPLFAEDEATAQYQNVHLTASVSVAKTPTGDVPPGQVIPFTLAFTNTGTGPLHNPVFIDELPMDAQGSQLILDPDRDPSVSPYSFILSGAAPEPPHGTPLPTDPDEIVIEENPDSIVFRMPEGSVLEPGQTYTIRINLMLRPGLTPNDDVVNWAAISVDEPFDDCARVLRPDGTCADDTVVRPLAIPALATVKYVKADAPHGQPGIPEVISTANDFSCEGQADADGFYRSPCVPVTLPGETETWRFRITNAGTLPMDRVVSIDNLPVPGDQGLIVLLPRESQWPPTFVGGIQLVETSTTPAGTTLETFYSTSSTPCTADLNPLGTQCAPGAWLPLDDTVDPAIVRSIKFVVDFPEELFNPGEELVLEFQTRTTPSVAIQTAFPIAWNTVSTGASALSGEEPVVVPGTEGRRVGVTYPTGPIQLQKIVSGPAAELAPATFPVRLECTVDGVPIAGLPVVVLIPGDPPVQVGGLPWGAECTAVEGYFGQTQTIIGTAVVGGPEDEIGLITVENVYEVADLVIRKTVESSALDHRDRPIEYGPFTFSVTCFFLGEEVWATGYDADNPMTASFSPGETWALAGLPVGAECTVTEDDDLGALDTSMTVTVGDETGEPVPGNTVDVVIAEDTGVEVVATNVFGAGSLALEKVVEGEAADDFGAGPFTLVVDCVLDTGSGPVRVWAGRVTLGGDLPLTATIDDIAMDATCTVTEPFAAGANETIIDPESVVIGNEQTVTVTVTNIFNAGSLTVTKVIDGDGAELWGAGPFEVLLECFTTLREPVEIPGGALRVLSAENGYTTTYEPLLVGLLCTLTETDAGGATSTTITIGEGEEAGVIQIVEGDIPVTVTNTFDIGSFTVTKTVSGGDAAAHANDMFRILAECTWSGGVIEIPGGGSRVLTVAEPVVYDQLPVGAECTVRETDAGTASAVTLTPADPADPSRALVVVGADAAASVSIDNRFDPALPPTGVDGSRWIGATLLATLLLGGGVLVLLAARRRRFG